MAAHIRREDDAVYFLTDERRHRDEEIAADPMVCLAFADADKQTHVSLTGDAQVLNDRAFDQTAVERPGPRLLGERGRPAYPHAQGHPHDAEYWDSPGTVMSYVEMAASIVTGSPADVGQNRKVAM
jgi:hypothetical protein